MPVTTLDTFGVTAADTDLAFHTSDSGDAWARHTSYGSNGLRISNAARVKPFTTGVTCSYYLDYTPADANYAVEADWYIHSFASSTFFGVQGRMSTSQDTCLVFFYAGNAAQWRLGKRVNGTFTQLGSGVAVTLVAGNTYTLRLEMSGTTIRAFVGGIEIISVTDSSISAAGFPGLYSNQGTSSNTAGAHADNFGFEAVSGGGSPGSSITVDNANWFFSPYNWRKSGTSYAQSNTPGAYFKTKFSGTSCKLDVDVSPLTGASVGASDYPTILYSVDGGAFTRRQLASSDTQITLATSLASGTHTLHVIFVAADWDSYDRWTTPAMVLRVTGLTLDSGASLSAPDLRPNRMLVFGDSHTEGYEALGTGATVANQDASQSYSALVPLALDAEYGVVGYASQGWNDAGPGASNIPTFEHSWDEYSNGQSRLAGGLLVPAPDFLLICHGDNDTAGATLRGVIVSTLTAIRAAAPDTPLFIALPPNLENESDLRTAVTTFGDGNTYVLDHGFDLLTNAYKNGSHPNVRGHAVWGSLLAGLAKDAIAPTPGEAGSIFGGGFVL